MHNLERPQPSVAVACVQTERQESWFGHSPRQPVWPSWLPDRDLWIRAVQTGLQPGCPADVHGEGEKERTMPQWRALYLTTLA
jgi:hypothetical protein